MVVVIVDLLRYDNFVIGLHIVLPAADYITRVQSLIVRFITLRSKSRFVIGAPQINYQESVS